MSFATFCKTLFLSIEFWFHQIFAAQHPGSDWLCNTNELRIPFVFHAYCYSNWFRNKGACRGRVLATWLFSICFFS